MADSDARIDIDAIVRSVVERMAAGGILSGASSAVDLSPDTTTREVPVNLRDDVKRVAVGADRAGLEAKGAVKAYLESLGYGVVDVDTDAPGGAACPEVAAAVARKVASGECDRGIVLDADGIGSAIACNKVKGIRAALCYDMRSVVNSRERVNANVMTLGGPLHGRAELCEYAKVWLEARFPGGTHWPTVNGIMSIETRGMR